MNVALLTNIVAPVRLDWCKCDLLELARLSSRKSEVDPSVVVMVDVALSTRIVCRTNA